MLLICKGYANFSNGRWANEITNSSCNNHKKPVPLKLYVFHATADNYFQHYENCFANQIKHASGATRNHAECDGDDKTHFSWRNSSPFFFATSLFNERLKWHCGIYARFNHNFARTGPNIFIQEASLLSPSVGFHGPAEIPQNTMRLGSRLIARFSQHLKILLIKNKLIKKI